LHGNGFKIVIIRGAGLHLLFKSEAIVRLIPKVEIGFIVLRGINDDHALFRERNVDVKHTNCETYDECRPRNIVQNRHDDVIE
jgi:hypothetical protein